MTFFLSSFFFFFSIFSISTNSTPFSPLLSLRCIPSPSNHTNNTNNNAHHHNTNPIETLLDNLTSEAPKSHMTTLNATFGHKHYSGLVQCRPGLSLKTCTLCVTRARYTILNLCQNPNSTFVSAWFDGCYIQIFSMTSCSSDIINNVAYTNTSNHSCSGRVNDLDLSRFESARTTLFLKLRADISIATHYGFSHGKIASGNTYKHGESKFIYGLVECVRSLTHIECDSCVEKAVDMLSFYCGGCNGGIVVYGLCHVRFECEEFYSAEVNVSGGGAWGDYAVWEGDEEGGNVRKLVVVGYWGGGVGCFLVFVFLAWLLRRAALNIAKVGEFDGMAGKIAE